MNILLIQHDPLDGPGSLLEWSESRGHSIASFLMSGEAPLPSLESVDFLVSLGGPMGAYEEEKHPWIATEKEYLRQSFAAGKKILGLCLGCQLLADALGGKSFRHTCKEFGWQPIEPTEVGGKWLGTDDVFMAFQWHGDTYTLPPGAVQLARNEAAEQQAFLMEGPAGNQVLGLQFHLEWTEKMALEIVQEPDIAPPVSAFVQSPKEILSDLSLFESAKKRFFHLIDGFVA